MNTHSIRPTRARFGALALISVGTMINYLDRTVMSVAAPTLSHDLGVNAAVMGLIFSAFSWTYVASQIPGGIFLDRFGTRLTYFLSVTFWSLFTLLQAFTTGVGALLACRFGLGAAESPCFPANSRIVGQWFPVQERARATGVYTVGEYLGLAFFSPFLYWLMTTFSWRALFVVVGLAGILFGLVWWRLYRDPADSPSVNQAELDHIEKGGGLAHTGAAKAGFSWARAAILLRSRQLWGASIGQFAGNSTLVFFLTWFPTYLATERHMGWVKVGFFAILPFLAGGLGVLSGGFFSDKLLASGRSPSLSRKLPIILGLVLAASIVLANYVNNDLIVILVLSAAFYGQGMVGLGWTLISDIAPKPLMGLAGGMFNFVAGLAGIVTPIVIGLILQVTHSFTYGLVFIASVATLGALSYIFLMGEVRRIQLPEDAP